LLFTPLTCPALSEAIPSFPGPKPVKMNLKVALLKANQAETHSKRCV
jgi:hypothetical protein